MIKKLFILISLLIILLFFFNIFFISLFSIKNQKSNMVTSNYNILPGNLSEDVLKFKTLVEKYVQKYRLDSKYINVILAVMMAESGGRDKEYSDVMQSSEGEFNTRYSKAPNSITDPEYSIECGVQELKKSLELTNEDLNFSLQIYNFGTGFYYYAKNKGGYTKENASNFSDMMALQLGWRSYGNKEYVDRVLKYLTVQQNSNLSGDEKFNLLMQEALKHEGKRYNMIPVAPIGADGNPITFDCSSLVQWCYSKALVIQLPRTAQAQYDFCGEQNQVTIDNAKPGDLVFWTGTYDTTDFISHVAIYCGNYTVYEAGDPIGYSKLNINSPNYVGIRRVYN